MYKSNNQATLHKNLLGPAPNDSCPVCATERGRERERECVRESVREAVRASETACDVSLFRLTYVCERVCVC